MSDKLFKLTQGKSSNAAKAITFPSRSRTEIAKNADSIKASILGLAKTLS